jgi:pimeloyl-ACP methyl ester carboxylesterase
MTSSDTVRKRRMQERPAATKPVRRRKPPAPAAPPLPVRVQRTTSAVPRLELVGYVPSVPTTRPPLLFVHGLGHGAWSWEEWLEAAAVAGHPAYAVSLRGHAGSEGDWRRGRLRDYVNEIIRVAASLPARPALVGHSTGALVVQHALARFPARAGVLIAPVPPGPALGTLARVLRQHPVDALRVLAGRSVSLRASYLFDDERDPRAQEHARRCEPASPRAQYELLLHRPPRRPRQDAPVLVLGSPDDRLVPIGSVRRTARHYEAVMREFPGLGHDLMLEPRWQEVHDAMLEWLRTIPLAPVAQQALADL